MVHSFWANTKISTFIKKRKCVVTWSGGLDTTALIAYVIKEFGCTVHPIFVNRKQTNYEREKASVKYHTKKFQKMFGSKFNKYFEVTIFSPPLEFKRYFKGSTRNTIYELRNSDLVNQAVRYALLLRINSVLVGSLRQDVQWADNSMGYWASKIQEIRDATGNNKLTVVPVFSHHEVNLSKSAIIKWCSKNDIDLSETWSCFEARKKPCKECEACRVRISAFKEAGVVDIAYQ